MDSYAFVRKWVVYILLALAVLALFPRARAACTLQDEGVCLPLIASGPDTFYVSRLGSNGDGLSWDTAWSDLDQINWQSIQPGNTILLDGGADEMVYVSTLKPERSGTAGRPITLRLSDEPGRNGRAVIFGGRTTPLPYCGQQNYVNQTADVRSYGMFFEDDAWLVIDGTKWSGITIYGHKRNAMRFQSTTSHITIRNVEAYDNGFAERKDDGWRSNSAGIRIAGQHHVFARMIVHDNGQDAFQSAAASPDGPDPSDNNLDNLTIRQSWLYNGRRHPDVPEAFNYCVHTDGVQIYTGGVLSSVRIEESIIGPGFTNGVILGQTPTNSGAEAVVNNVTLRDVVFSKAAENSILGYRGTQPRGWTIDHVTGHCPATAGHCLYLAGTDHVVTNSILVGAAVTLPDGLSATTNNCQWQTTGYALGLFANPRFVDVDDQDPFSVDDYSLVAGSPCAGRGSRISSVTALLDLQD